MIVAVAINSMQCIIYILEISSIHREASCYQTGKTLF
jgi:hypothetical protein